MCIRNIEYQFQQDFIGSVELPIPSRSFEIPFHSNHNSTILNKAAVHGFWGVGLLFVCFWDTLVTERIRKAKPLLRKGKKLGKDRQFKGLQFESLF